MKPFFILLFGIISLSIFICFGGNSDTANSLPIKGEKSVISAKSPNKKKEKNSMPFDSQLPMGITEETPLNKIVLVYGFYSAKTGAGRQELTITADGTIKLFYSRSYNDQNPKTMEAKCSSEQILRLLDFLEGMGFFGLPDEFSSNDHPHARRLLKFSMPGREKVIAVDEPGNYAIEQCIGAIRLCAGLCIPEAINQRFFPNL